MTVGPSRESAIDVATVGVAAHICAASPGGPRYDATMSPDERSSIENGIWLCATHATLIDRDVVRFSVDTLRRWKVDHESYVERNLGEIVTHEATPSLGGRPISAEAARIASERATGWEYRLFAQLLRDEVRLSIDDARHLKYGITLGPIRTMHPQDIADSIRSAMTEATAIVHATQMLVDKPLQEALGPPGKPGDPELLEYVAHSVAELHRKCIRWGLEWLHTRCSRDETSRLLQLMPEFMREVQDALGRLPDTIDDTCEAAITALSSGSRTYDATLTIRLSIPSHIAQEIGTEIDRLAPLLAERS